jgi:hypothetical protein
MFCPHCSKEFSHSCAQEVGRSAKGKTSDRKSATSKANFTKAREVLAIKRAVAKPAVPEPAPAMEVISTTYPCGCIRSQISDFETRWAYCPKHQR